MERTTRRSLSKTTTLPDLSTNPSSTRSAETFHSVHRCIQEWPRSNPCTRRTWQTALCDSLCKQSHQQTADQLWEHQIGMPCSHMGGHLVQTLPHWKKVHPDYRPCSSQMVTAPKRPHWNPCLMDPYPPRLRNQHHPQSGKDSQQCWCSLPHDPMNQRKGVPRNCTLKEVPKTIKEQEDLIRQEH